MVVARKKPGAPMPPNSRTNSSQPLPRAVKGKSTQYDSQPEVERDGTASAGKEALSSPPKGMSSKSKSNSKKPSSPSNKRKRRSLFDRLFLPFLGAIFLYALVLCPTDRSHEHAICRSLSTYRRVILEPYVLPPIRAAVTHPTVTDAYKTHVEPHVARVQVATAPYVQKVLVAEQHVRPHVVRVARVTSSAVLRTWEGVIKPYWTRAVVPRYHLYIAPLVERHVVPVYDAAYAYVRQAEPHIQKSVLRVSKEYHAIRPHFVKAYETVKPRVIRAYTTAKPHAVALWERITPLLSAAWKQAQIQTRVAFRLLGLQVSRATREVGNARRQYVDPHIHRIWEKVAESSSSISTPTPSSINLGDIPDTDEANATVESIPQPTRPAHSINTPLPSIPAEPEVPHQEVVVTKIPAPEETAGDEYPNSTPTATPAEPEELAVSVAEASAGHASSVVGELEREVRSAVVNEISEQVTPMPEAQPTATLTPVAEVEEPILSAASVVAASAAGVSAINVEEEDVVPTSVADDAEDIDDFLRDIGLNESSPEEVVEDEVASSISDAPPVLSDAEKAAAVAAKRADIVGRHTRWQAELDSFSKEQERVVRESVKNVRDAAVTELKEMAKGLRDISGKVLAKKDPGQGKGIIGSVEGEGEKLLRGLEGYLKKAEVRSAGWKREPGVKDAAKDEKRKEEESKWGKVTEKVNEKFSEVVNNVQGEIHAWYMGVREREVQLVLQVSAEVKSIADRAQADIGLDYAWLDDVTYLDWQKYHDLMRTHEAFEQTARSIQNGTHPTSPSDPLMPALSSLQHEMQDLITGFAVRIQEIAAQGRGIFSPFTTPEEEEDTTFNIPNLVQDDLSAEDTTFNIPNLVQDDLSAEEPTYSILPISPATGESKNEEVVDAAKVIIGKSKEQVEGALAGVSMEPSVEQGVEGESENEKVADAAKVVIGKSREQVEEALSGVSMEPSAAVNREEL